MERLTLWAIVARGGWMIYPIVPLFARGNVCDRGIVFWRFGALRRAIPRSWDGSERCLKRTMWTARASCARGETGPVAAVLTAGLARVGRGREQLRDALERTANAEIWSLERHLSTLATLATIAPLLGFLGTVMGMIRAFMKIEALAGNVNAEVLAGGIWEAMVTTAAGLAVGIPTLIFHNTFVGRVGRVAHELESGASQLLEVTQARGRGLP